MIFVSLDVAIYSICMSSVEYKVINHPMN